MEDDCNSQISFELHDFNAATPSSGNSPPPPYGARSDTTSLEASSIDQGEIIEDSFSVTTESSAASYSGGGQSRGYFSVEGDYDYPDIIPADIRKVVLQKNFLGFGLTVAGGADSPYGELPVFVTSLDPRGPASESGHVRLGDRIVSVNGRDMEGKTHAEVVHVIKQSGRKVVLELTEGPENIMNYLEFD